MTISTFAAHAPIRMAVGTRLFVGVLNVLVGLVSLVALVAAYGLSERLVSAQERAGSRALATESWTWWGPDVAMSLNMSLLLLGALSVVVVNAGLVSIGDTTTSTAGVTVLAAAGALAGLFTDQTLQRMSRAFGATPPDTPATSSAIAASGVPGQAVASA